MQQPPSSCCSVNKHSNIRYDKYVRALVCATEAQIVVVVVIRSDKIIERRILNEILLG